MSKWVSKKKKIVIPKGFTECGLPFGPIYKGSLQEQDSFVKRDMNKPGTMIIMEGAGRTYLIGHINQWAGCCDDCKLFEPGTIVLAWKVIEC